MKFSSDWREREIGWNNMATFPITRTVICMLKMSIFETIQTNKLSANEDLENLDSKSEHYFWVLCLAWNSVLRMFNSRYKRTSRKTWKDSLKFFQSCWTFCLLKDYSGFISEKKLFHALYIENNEYLISIYNSASI